MLVQYSFVAGQPIKVTLMSNINVNEVTKIGATAAAEAAAHGRVDALYFKFNDCSNDSDGNGISKDCRMHNKLSGSVMG